MGIVVRFAISFCPLLLLVALNYQTEDKANHYNRGRFVDNGGCGFVLKPEFLRDVVGHPSYSPVSPCGLSETRFPPWRLELQVLSGQHIPKPEGEVRGEVIDPYVKVRIRGHPDDVHGGNKAKTDHVCNNGFNPVWNSKRYEWSDEVRLQFQPKCNTTLLIICRFDFEVKVPDLALLEIKVKDHSTSGSDRDIGSFCAPLTIIHEGQWE